MSVIGFLKGLVNPALEVIDDAHFSGEEKGKLKAQLLTLEHELTAKILEYETKLMDAQAKIITAEAQSDSWLAKSWRPIFALTLVAFWAAGKVGWGEPVSEAEISLMKICLGGYIIGRSGEKVVKSAPKVLANAKELLK